MRQTILAAAAAFVIGGVATGAVLSQAQPAAPPAADGAAGQMAGQRAQWMGWRHHMHAGLGLRTFALIYRQQDRQLAAADVQKIAEAFLLWNGNHAWKVTDVAATADGPIGFSLATPEGSVVAKFTMDPHSARITRVD
jgi:hypothetical protein